ITQLTIANRINTSIRIFPFFATHKFNIKLPIFIVKEETRLKPLLVSIKK
ncbi:hypothetical protein QR685DRAFT_436392, partial [Neurospora intermedia]